MFRGIAKYQLVQGFIRKFVTHSCMGVPATTNVRAVQEGVTSIIVSWSPSSDTTGYRISYTSPGPTSGSVNVSGGSTDHYLLSGLQNGISYNISIVATSYHSFPSESVVINGVGKAVFIHR